MVLASRTEAIEQFSYRCSRIGFLVGAIAQLYQRIGFFYT